MYEFHGWFYLAETTEEADATGVLDERLDQLRDLLGRLHWFSARADLLVLNGGAFLVLTGLVNRRRYEAADVEELLHWLAANLPGSYGLLYEQSPDMPVPPGQGAFRVRVLARGQLQERLDPFSSPTNPTIED